VFGNWTTRGLADAAKRTKTKHAKSPVASASCPVTMCSLLIVNITVNSTTLQDCWATVCKTVRPMLSVRCLSCLFVTSVYCGQTVGRIGMPLDADVGLGLGHIVRLGPSSPQWHSLPNFRPMSVVAKRSSISATAELFYGTLRFWQVMARRLKEKSLLSDVTL